MDVSFVFLDYCSKTSVKITKTRLEAVKKKKNSVIKHLKNDMADLIRTDHAYKAFCRVSFSSWVFYDAVA